MCMLTIASAERFAAFLHDIASRTNFEKLIGADAC